MKPWKRTIIRSVQSNARQKRLLQRTVVMKSAS
jgi:hypothetical protein